MKFRIALILLVITLLVVIVPTTTPAYAQESTPRATAAATAEAPAAAAVATTEAAATGTVEAAAVATTEATAIIDSAPETHPVAGVAETSESETSVPGATSLVLIVGFLAVLTVGGVAWMRENYKAPKE